MENQDVHRDSQYTVPDGFHLIKRGTLLKLVRMNYKLSNMLILVSTVCDLKKVEITLSAEEVCEVLKIKPKQLEECRKKQWIKSWSNNKYQYYKAYSMSSRIHEFTNSRVHEFMSSRIHEFTSS